MRKTQFKKLLNSVEKLTPRQASQLQATLDVMRTERDSLHFIESARPSACHHCGSVHLVRNGVRNGLQRLLCRSCNKTFNATTGTPLARLRHKEKFERYARCLKDGLSIRASATVVGISLDTAFRWRHRFLQNVQHHQPRELTGLLEVDETFFRESQKGSRKLTRPARRRGGKTKGVPGGRLAKDFVPVLVGRSRGQPHTTDKVLKAVNGAEVTDALKEVVKPGETVLCTDGHSAYLHLQRTLGVQTKSFSARFPHRGLDKVYHIQSANSYHERLKTWIQRGLRGVATKYLPNYLAWMRMLTWDKQGISSQHIIISALGKQVINL